MSTKKDLSNELIYEEEFIWPSKEFRILGLLAYTPGGFILPYLLWHSDKPFVVFHVKQGFILFSIFVLASLFPLAGTFGFAIFIYVFICAWHAYHAFNGEEYRMGWVNTLLLKWNASQKEDVLGDLEKDIPPQTHSTEDSKDSNEKTPIS